MDLKLLTLDLVVNSGIPVPELINLNAIGLFKKLTYSKGILTRIEYYTGFDGENYDNLIAMDFFTQTFNGIIYTGETKTTYYYDPAGAIGYQTAFTTTFVDEESFDFGIRKRNNLLTDAKFYALNQLGVVNQEDLIGSLPTQITQYLNGPYQPIVNELNALVGVKVYLTQPIADAMIAILTDF